MARVLASASTEIGDNKTARDSYEQILKTQPQAHWARLALGDLFLAQGDATAAEKEYRAVRQADPTNREAILRVARVLIARGDFNEAMAEVSTDKSPAGTTKERLDTVSVLFDEIAAKTADSVAQNRQAFDGGQLSREAFFKATQAQSGRVDSLVSLLRSSAPPSGSPEGLTAPFHRRIAAAALLSQAVGAMLTFLESDDKKAGEQARLFLGEFRRELAAAS
jgi:predicted Zn-dependent protease